MNTEQAQKALAIAVKVLYFDDSADYESALWEIVEALGGKEASNMLTDNAERAWETYVDKLAGYN